MKGFKFVNTVLSFVLAIFLFMSASLGALYLSVFNEQKTLGMFVSEEYMSASYDDFMSSMEALATPSTRISVRIDGDDKDKFADVCESIGVPVGRAIKIFMRLCVNKGALPF
mgnify:CR=1 FL=1